MAELDLEQLVDQLLEHRGIKDKKQFFNPPYFDSKLRNPFLIPGIENAVKRLKSAHRNDELVVIYGDYDIDGLTATALLKDAFESFGLRIEMYTPDRFGEGYGLNSDALEHIKNKLRADVVVTVDCGTVSFEELEYAQKIKLDVVVTDHHQPHEELPPAVAIVNPHRSDNKYPYSDFAGVGVAFKLVQAMQEQMDGLELGQEKWLLDLVTLGTVCDVVPLTDENRSLVYWGLQVLSQTKRVGLQELMRSSRVDTKSVSTEDLGFRLGPRLNSSGRLTHAKRSLKLLTTNNQSEAENLATELEQLNSQRRTIQQKVLDQAAEQAASLDDSVIVVAGEQWNEGVIGIVAARLLEMFEKPAFVFSIDGDVAKASARAYGDFSAVNAIRAAEEVLISGGGHAAAGGCSVKTKDIDKFRQLVNDFYLSLKLDPAQQRLQRKPQPDATISDYSFLQPKLLDLLSKLEPFGQANPRPVFDIEVASFSQKLVGADKNHLKLSLVDEAGQKVGGILFRQDEHLPKLERVAATINYSDYDPRGVDLIVKDYT